MLLRQLSYAIKTQLKTFAIPLRKAAKVVFRGHFSDVVR